MGKIDLSIVVPLFNEEQSIEPLYRAISDVVSNIGRAYEIIFVDDGSADRTFEIAGQLAAADENLKGSSQRLRR